MQKQFQGKQSGNKSNLVIIVVGFILPVVVGVAVYLWQQSVLKSERNEARDVQSALQQQIQMLKGQIDSNLETDKATEEKSAEFDAAAAKTIVEANRWADLKEYSADSVEVIIGASEGIGTRTVDQMIEDLKYLNEASGPWNFSLESSVIDDYKTGDYRNFFMAEKQIIGRSSDGVVVVFTLGDDKITDIFMIASDELL